MGERHNTIYHCVLFPTHIGPVIITLNADSYIHDGRWDLQQPGDQNNKEQGRLKKNSKEKENLEI